MRKYFVFASKGFRQNIQYMASHLINTFASAFFGLIYMYLWRSVIPGTGFGRYTVETMIHYIAFNQTILWFTNFGIRIQSHIAAAVRSGTIGIEMVRPVRFAAYRVACEMGSQLYGLLFRGIPCGLLLSHVGYYIPANPWTWVWTAVSLFLGGYVSALLMYMVGISSFWTTEIRTAYWTVVTSTYYLGGASMPLDVLPEKLRALAEWLPFPCAAYYPSRIFLELSGPGTIWRSLCWSALLTITAELMTEAAVKKLEVQGG